MQPVSRQLLRARWKAWRRRLYAILEQDSSNDGASLAVNGLLVFLVVITLTATVLESVPRLAITYAEPFRGIEIVATAVFTLEYLARLWCAPEHPPFRRYGPLLSRLRYVTGLSGLIDLGALLPLWLGFFIAADFKTLLVLRLVRYFKLTRYSPAIRSLLEALYSERHALTGCFVILFGAALIAAAGMHLAERDAQPAVFGTIPDALWWAVVTLGTVGYGDAVPVTPIGRMLAGLTIFAGLLMMALPIGIVASAFADEVHRRDFVITWGLVARIPLFSELSAAEVAEVMKVLRAQKLESGAVIARRGEQARAMYLIADGEVEVRLRHKRFRLGTGQFFGEIAALRRTRRSSTIVTVAPTRLLVLDTLDLHALMDRQPELARRIESAAREKLGGDLEEPDLDIAESELAGSPAP